MSGDPYFTVERPERPYPGLRPFEAHEWSIFFGRERMVDEVIGRLARNRLALIHGASGSGKSSLVRAGVMPKLARQHRRHSRPWLTCAMRPADGPAWNLATELATLEGRGEDTARIDDIVSAFNKRDVSLAQVVAGIEVLAGKSLCILVDQFEELFRFEETSREEAELFVELIARATREETGADVHVIVTMRSEFLGQCARFAGLAEAVNETQYLVPRMDDEALLRAVCRPAQMFNGVVGEDLAYRLISRVRGREDELPLLQHGLMLMWDEAARRPVADGRIVLDGTRVETTGGPAELLSDHADRVMDSVAPDPARARIVESVFRELTDVNAEGAAIRRPRTCADLAAVAGTTVDVLRPILDAFRAPGVSFLTPYAPTPISETTIIDISHEALIRCWRRLGSGREGWLKQELDDGLAWRSLLAEAEAFKGDSARVLSAAATKDRGKLVEARTETWTGRYGGGWLLVNQLLQASSRSAAKSRWKTRAAMTSLAALTVGALVLSYVSLDSERKLRNQTDNANRRGNVVRLMVESQIGIGDSLISKNNVEKALFDEIKSMAAPGDPISDYEMGLLYYNGFGTRSNSVETFRSIMKSARSNYAPAFNMVGKLYDNGFGVAKDYKKAREWYERAAAAGDISAMYNLGFLYGNGHGVALDYDKAREWFEKAAAAGDSFAMYNLGQIYASGKGLPKDYRKAREWFERAAAAGDAASMYNLGVIYEHGNGAVQNYGAAQEWYEKAASAGDASAMYNLGYLYEHGYGVTQDPGRAKQWYDRAQSSACFRSVLSRHSL